MALPSSCHQQPAQICPRNLDSFTASTRLSSTPPHPLQVLDSHHTCPQTPSLIPHPATHSIRNTHPKLRGSPPSRPHRPPPCMHTCTHAPRHSSHIPQLTASSCCRLQTEGDATLRTLVTQPDFNDRCNVFESLEEKRKTEGS